MFGIIRAGCRQNGWDTFTEVNHWSESLKFRNLLDFFQLIGKFPACKPFSEHLCLAFALIITLMKNLKILGIGKDKPKEMFMFWYKRKIASCRCLVRGQSFLHGWLDFAGVLKLFEEDLRDVKNLPILKGFGIFFRVFLIKNWYSKKYGYFSAWLILK